MLGTSSGGLAFCQVCGAVSLGGGRRTRLPLTCGAKPGKKTTRPKLIGEGQQAKRMPGGSEWRIRKLLSGNLVGMSKWPDGSSKEVIIVPDRVFPSPFVPTNPKVVEQPGAMSSGELCLLP